MSNWITRHRATLAVSNAGVALCILAGCSGAALPASSPTAASPQSSAFAQQEALFSPPSVTGRAKYVFVGNNGGGPNAEILVFKATATGNATPVATIAGSNTLLTYPSQLYHQGSRLYVDNYGNAGSSIEAFTKPGNVAPVVDISGSNTQLGLEDAITLDARGDIFAESTDLNNVAVFSAGMSGNVAPAHLISGSATQLNNPQGLDLDPKSGNLFVANNNTNTIVAFSPSANGNVAPLYGIAGSNTGLCLPSSGVFDAQGYYYVANSNFQGGCGAAAILVFAPGARGNVAPVRTIVGSNTLLNVPDSIRIDGKGYVYVNDQASSDVKVFAPGANGNVAPVQDITGLSNPHGVAIL